MKKFMMPLILILLETYLFSSRESVDNELFFFIWTFVFGAFFLFRWVEGDAGFSGIGRSDGDIVHNLAAKAAETIFEADKVKKVRLPLIDDLLLLGLCLVNLVLTFLIPQGL